MSYYSSGTLSVEFVMNAPLEDWNDWDDCILELMKEMRE